MIKSTKTQQATKCRERKHRITPGNHSNYKYNYKKNSSAESRTVNLPDNTRDSPKQNKVATILGCNEKIRTIATIYFIHKNFFKVRSCLKAFFIYDNLFHIKSLQQILLCIFIHLSLQTPVSLIEWLNVLHDNPSHFYYGCYYSSYICQLCLDIGYLLFMYLFAYILK